MKNYTVGILILAVLLGAVYALSLMQKPPIQSVSATFSCNEGKSISAVFHTSEPKEPEKAGEPPIPTGSVDVTLSDGRSLTLIQTISASGVRYANPDESFVFWNKGNGALVFENNQAKTYIGCVTVAQEPPGSGLSAIYHETGGEFSVRYPGTWIADSAYEYANLGPEEPKIPGVKFTVSGSTIEGTNLSSDTGISVEEMPNMPTCTAYPFLISPGSVIDETIDGITYSVARASDAAAGNRYEETVYAISGTNPCLAVRYFVHYGAIENYEPGAIKEFDRAALLKTFDDVRRTLTVNQ